MEQLVDVRYINDQDEVLMKEQIPFWRIPPRKRMIFWNNSMWKVSYIVEHWEEKYIEVCLEQL